MQYILRLFGDDIIALIKKHVPDVQHVHIDDEGPIMFDVHVGLLVAPDFRQRAAEAASAATGFAIPSDVTQETHPMLRNTLPPEENPTGMAHDGLQVARLPDERAVLGRDPLQEGEDELAKRLAAADVRREEMEKSDKERRAQWLATRVARREELLESFEKKRGYLVDPKNRASFGDTLVEIVDEALEDAR